jgi:asparagine synthetase B (glutamine-hydrolysing)
LLAVCGLLGLLTAGADAADRTEAIAGALRCARHRGPDESGTWNDDDVVLGFNRLSIIDVAGSHQPLHWDPSGAHMRSGRESGGAHMRSGGDSGGGAPRGWG